MLQATLAQTGAIPVGAVTQPQLIPVMQEQMISDVGQVGTAPVAPTAQATTAQADAPITATATHMEASTGKSSRYKTLYRRIRQHRQT